MNLDESPRARYSELLDGTLAEITNVKLHISDGAEPSGITTHDAVPIEDDSLDGGQGARPSKETESDVDEIGVFTYMDSVRERFRDRIDVYDTFVDIMRDFKMHRIDTLEVMNRVSVLFRGHNDLILAFDMFLPSGYKMACSSDVTDTTAASSSGSTPNEIRIGQTSVQLPATASHSNLADALQFVTKVKSRHPDNYGNFFEILQSFKRNERNRGDVINKCMDFLKDSPDLLDEFVRVHVPVYPGQVPVNASTAARRRARGKGTPRRRRT